MTMMNKFGKKQTLLFISLAAINTGCTTLGPEYQRASVNTPTTYKEADGFATTQKKLIEKSWWTIYNDDELNQLMAELNHQNYTLQAVTAKANQARLLASVVQAGQSPTLVAGGTNDLGLLVNWEVDLWGKIQRNIEAANAFSEASAADLAAIKLSLQAKLAENYFLLRIKDEDIRLLKTTLSSYQRTLEITRNNFVLGTLGEESVAQAQAQLSNAQVLVYSAELARIQLEHAIGVIIGKAPADFSLETSLILDMVPDVPVDLPASLLMRRPDIIAAERRMAAASAKIGIAVAQAYPAFDLFAGVSIGQGIFGGAEVKAPLYTAGAIEGNELKAKAFYDEMIANYRQTVLNSFMEVEDNLAALRILTLAAKSQDNAVKASRQTVRIFENQYNAGIINQQSLIIEQGIALNNERSALSLLGRRLVASVNLVKALGGGWKLLQNEHAEDFRR